MFFGGGIPMFRAEKMIWLLLALVFALLVLSSNAVLGETPFSQIEEKLDGLSEEQSKNLKNLFLMVQEIEELERAEELIALELKAIKREINQLEEELIEEETAYQEKQEILKQVLKSYQRSGPGSYLELILDSDNLTMFLRRLNALKEITKNTGELLASLKKSKEKLAEERKTLDHKLFLVENKQVQLKKSYQEKLVLKEKQEEYLASLAEERAFYQEYLGNLKQSWDNLKPIFSKITEEAARIIKAGSLSEDAMKFTFTSAGLKGTIAEGTFNKILMGQGALPEMVFNFTPGVIEMNLPQQNLSLTGTFEIISGHTLKFIAHEGSFAGLLLSRSSIKDLFRDQDLVFNFQPLLGKARLESIETKKDLLELKIKPVF